MGLNDCFYFQRLVKTNKIFEKCEDTGSIENAMLHCCNRFFVAGEKNSASFALNVHV